MRRALALAALLLALTACGSVEPVTGGEVSNNEVGVVQVETGDGGTVDCVLWDGRRAGGIDCDWDDAE